MRTKQTRSRPGTFPLMFDDVNICIQSSLAGFLSLVHFPPTYRAPCTHQIARARPEPWVTADRLTFAKVKLSHGNARATGSMNTVRVVNVLSMLC